MAQAEVPFIKSPNNEIVLDRDVATLTAMQHLTLSGNMDKCPLSCSGTYLPWNDYFMSLCFLTAARSKDPRTKVGACIVDKENRIVSLGYNGMPRGISDDDLPWDKEATHSYDTKFPYVCHAEMNAIINQRYAALDDCSLYVTKFPCCECAKLIIQSGLKNVIFAEVKPEPVEEQIPTSKMFTLAGVTCRKFIPSVYQVSLNVTNGAGNVCVTKES